MHRSAVITALLVASSPLWWAQAGGGQAPPGGDQVGSGRSTQLPGHSAHSDPQQNQRMTGTMGTTRGNEQQPAYAGHSTHSTVAAQSSSGAVGQQGKTAATAGRRRAHDQAQSPYASNQNTSQTAKHSAASSGPTLLVTFSRRIFVSAS